jgi:alpha-tubulin suppressor-like RCC1 family protein
VLKNDGSLWASGYNNYGQLGDGTTNTAPLPIMIGTNRDWAQIAAGDFSSFALKKNGTLWGWGVVCFTTTNLVPHEIALGTTWRSISANGFILVALKSDGTLWLKGGDAHNVASTFVPNPTENLTQIGPDTNWAEVYAGGHSFFARKRDGSWWVSGINHCGELGIGTSVTAVTSPQRLTFNFEPWAFEPEIGTTLMLSKDGNLWTWGWRFGTPRSAAAQKIRSWLAAVVLRFPGLGFQVKPTIHIIDQTPFRLWELPKEVRQSLGRGPINTTNELSG